MTFSTISAWSIYFPLIFRIMILTRVIRLWPSPSSAITLPTCVSTSRAKVVLTTTTHTLSPTTTTTTTIYILLVWLVIPKIFPWFRVIQITLVTFFAITLQKEIALRFIRLLILSKGLLLLVATLVLHSTLIVLVFHIYNL